MRKQSSMIALILLCCMPACAPESARNGGPENSGSNAPSNPDRGKAVLQLEGGTVTVDYGRPALKGRDLEKLIEPGREWRMGANDPTTLNTDVDLKFGDKVVPRGKYNLKAKPVAQQDWLLLVETPENEAVAEIPLEFAKVDASSDLLTIELAGKGTGGRFLLRWGNLTLAKDFQKA